MAWCRWVDGIAAKHLRLLFADMRKCAAMSTSHLDGISGHRAHDIINAFVGGLKAFSPP